MLFEYSSQYSIVNEEEYGPKMDEISEKLNEICTRGYFTSFDGGKMFYEFFKVKNPKANIVVVHGYTEFTKKYYELAWYFLNMGYNVFLYDVRGHGYSARHSDDTEMTHVDKYEDYAKDLQAYINEIVMPNGDGVPLYLYAHSMGGAIAQLYLQSCKAPIKKTLLSAPMIYPFTPPLPRFVLKKLLKGEAKKFGWDAKFKFSSNFNPEVKVEKSNDTSLARFRYNLDMRINDINYRNSYGSNRWNFEAITAVEKLLNKKLAKNVNCELFVIIAGKDTAVNPKYQKKFVKLTKCRYKLFENSKHSLYTQADKELKEYVDMVLEFYEN